MSATERRALSVLILVAVASCGGGREVPLSRTVPKPEAAIASDDEARVVIRVDWDHDGRPDLLTLDTSTNPLRIVDAIRGTEDGGGEAASAAWRGLVVEGALNDALQQYLTRSLSGGTATDLDVLL